jgi:hypothetical protein
MRLLSDEIYNGGIGFEFPAEYKAGLKKFYAFKESLNNQNKDKITEISISFVLIKTAH